MPEYSSQTTSTTKASDTRPLKLQEIDSNYQESFQFLNNRKLRQVKQLVLLNNLQRGDQNIASTLLITLFNRVLAALYDDKIQIKFLPSQGITQDQINSYNVLAQSDYLEMGKAKHDYDWCWDTLFFGRGFMETYQFDTKRKILKPHVINPLMFGYDPYFENPHDWRYYWKWVTKSKYQLQKLIKSGKITGIKEVKEIKSGQDPFLWQYKIERDSATKAVQPPIEPAANDVYQILEYFGHDEDGKKCVYWVDKEFSKVLMKEELTLDDMIGEDEKPDSKWPIVVKESFRIPHSSVPFSIADLLEDKHRAKSVLLNLAYIAAKDQANPVYWYDKDRIQDVAQFFSRQINQHIPVEGDGSTAIGVLNTKDPMSPGLLEFISLITTESNEPVGTGTTAQPYPANKQNTATEAALDQQLNDMAQSLFSKVFQFGEAEFWSDWWHRYQKHADELEYKMANIVGVKGVNTQKIDLGDFKTQFPPGVLVFSAKEAEYKNLIKRRDLMQLYPQLAATLDPDGMRNFNKHVFFPLMLEDPSLIDVMLPKTLDEMKAEEENEQLKGDVMPNVSPQDDHTTHIYTHHMVQPKTWATWFHIQWHEEELAKQKAQEQQAMKMEMAEGGGMPGQMKVGKERSSPQGSATPLKSELTAKKPAIIKNVNKQ